MWNEFETSSTEEIKFASAIDGIQPLPNHLITDTADDSVIPAEKVRNKKKYIKDIAPKLWQLVEELRKL